MPSTPLFHFGHGLSYTTFVYSPLTLTEDTVDVGERDGVTNSGKRRGAEVVQLYGELVMEPGPIEISAGSSSSDIRSRAAVTVTGKTRPIKGENGASLSTAVSS